MSHASEDYHPKVPSQTVLFHVVRDYLETFRQGAAAWRDGEGLPRFVEEELRDFLSCGCLARGFARFRCRACGLDRLVPFSCKGRGFCPSCGGRRMGERAAHLVDEVLPAVPVRQWVLTLPHRIRYQLAWDHDLCRAVVGVFVRTVLRSLGRLAREQGVTGGRGGAVAIVQRFGGALNLNVHVHALVIDGVFTRDGAGVHFWSAPPLTAPDVAEVLAAVDPAVKRVLTAHGLGDGQMAPDAWADDEPVLAGIAAASVQNRFAFGPRPGGRVRRCGDPIDQEAGADTPRCHASHDGFDLHAGVRIPAGHPVRLERLCRYTLRPPVAQDRLQLTADGQVLLQLRRRWSDGTTHLLFHPVELLERLAALIPRPRVNLILYHGVLAPRAAWRPLVVRFGKDRGAVAAVEGEPPAAADDASEGEAPDRQPAAGRLWADLMRRTFGIDVLACPRCGGRFQLVALIERAEVIQRILRHLGLPTEVPQPRPGRAPPLPFAFAKRQLASPSGVAVEESP